MSSALCPFLCAETGVDNPLCTAVPVGTLGGVRGNLNVGVGSGEKIGRGGCTCAKLILLGGVAGPKLILSGGIAGPGLQ